LMAMFATSKHQSGYDLAFLPWVHSPSTHICHSALNIFLIIRVSKEMVMLCIVRSDKNKKLGVFPPIHWCGFHHKSSLYLPNPFHLPPTILSPYQLLLQVMDATQVKELCSDARGHRPLIHGQGSGSAAT
jgi:hypothetical protein